MDNDDKPRYSAVGAADELQRYSHAAGMESALNGVASTMEKLATQAFLDESDERASRYRRLAKQYRSEAQSWGSRSDSRDTEGARATLEFLDEKYPAPTPPEPCA